VNMGFLSLKDLEGHNLTMWAFGNLAIVCIVATEKYGPLSFSFFILFLLTPRLINNF
jgi:hypothetical protein